MIGRIGKEKITMPQHLYLSTSTGFNFFALRTKEGVDIAMLPILYKGRSVKDFVMQFPGNIPDFFQKRGIPHLELRGNTFIIYKYNDDYKKNIIIEEDVEDIKSSTGIISKMNCDFVKSRLKGVFLGKKLSVEDNETLMEEAVSDFFKADLHLIAWSKLKEKKKV